MIWQPIETAPKRQWIIGRREGGDEAGIAPAFVGKVYDMRKNALIDPWRGRWVTVTHWAPLPDFASATPDSPSTVAAPPHSNNTTLTPSGGGAVSGHSDEGISHG